MPMLKRFVLIFSIGFLLIQCSTIKEKETDREDNLEFKNFTQNFLKDYWQVHPQEASQLGLNEFDSFLEIPSKENFDVKLSFYKSYLEKIKEIKESDLSFSQRMDLKLIENKLNSSIWHYEKFKDQEWDPSKYNIGSTVSGVLEKQNRPLEERINDVSAKLLKSQEYYQVAQNNIKQPTSEHLQLAIKQNQGLEDYLKKDVIKIIQKSKLNSRDKKTAKQRVYTAAAATKNYTLFLKKIASHPETVGGFRSFRLGAELYKEKFNFDLQIEKSPEELYKNALDAKEETRSKIFETAIELYPKYFGEKLPPKDRQTVIENVINKVSKKHMKPKDFVANVKAQLPELTKFINDKNLLTLDPSKPLKVRETPLYERGFAGASVDSPGPYDKGRETFYNVTPLDNMSPKQKESYLREYNDYTLQILNIHEAIPGHYVQLVYSNQSPSLIKSIFGNGPMIEGWAVYSERMMLEEGYGNDSQELWLMYYKWFLRVVTNTIIDYEIHNKDLSKEEAMKMMTVDAFQEKAEAEGKWTRATVSQVQLASYFAGFSEIYQLREAIKKEKGEMFNLKEFHEKFLSFGSAPIKEIKKRML
jgi:uncharacterized protein (DUF885 family)